MEFYEAIIYIIGVGLLGILVGIIIGVILAAEQILRLRDDNEKLRKALGKAQEYVRNKPEIINIMTPAEGKNIPTFGD